MRKANMYSIYSKIRPVGEIQLFVFTADNIYFF